MKLVELIIVSQSRPGLVVKPTRKILPELSVADILERVKLGEPLFQWRLNTVDHDKVAASLLALCDAFDANGVRYNIIHKLSGVSLAGEPSRDLVEQIDKSMLLRLLKQWNEIRDEQARMAELEEGQ